MLTGSLGMLPSASLAGLPKPGVTTRRTLSLPKGSRPALYEPIHGTAPDIAGQGVANPIGAILSTAMLLRFSLGLEREASSVEEAVEGVLAEGYRTRTSQVTVANWSGPPRWATSSPAESRTCLVLLKTS